MDLKHKDSYKELVKSPGKIFLFGLATLLVVIGISQSSSILDLLKGFLYITFQPSTLDFDVFAHGGLDVAFFNAGVLLFIVISIFHFTKTEFKGIQIAAGFMIAGFAMYGKNILNIWFPIVGVFIYGSFTNKKLNESSAMACFSTAIAPIFSVLAFGDSINNQFLALIVGSFFGILAGFMIGYFGDLLPEIHKDYTMYNAGFAAGITGFLLNSLLKLLGIGHDKFPYVEISTAIEKGIKADFYYGNNLKISFILLVIFIYIIVSGVFLDGHKSYKKLLIHRSEDEDYTKEFGFGSTFINIGIVGLLATLFVFTTIKGQLNGTVLAAIFTAAGFAAVGVTVRSQLVLMYGVYLIAFLFGGIDYVSSRGMILSAIFSIGFSPVVGEFGFMYGIFVTFCHVFLVTSTGALHGWMSLYNNGFSISLIVTFIILIKKINDEHVSNKY